MEKTTQKTEKSLKNNEIDILIFLLGTYDMPGVQNKLDGVWLHELANKLKKMRKL